MAKIAFSSNNERRGKEWVQGSVGMAERGMEWRGEEVHREILVGGVLGRVVEAVPSSPPPPASPAAPGRHLEGGRMSIEAANLSARQKRGRRREQRRGARGSAASAAVPRGVVVPGWLC
ncbi:Os07g0611550 [Oryza sativa Japonica Group]|jgi:hypothetical protein|uniref:Os07g0611550 protein n=1 Tax=Oryza sativa subsp. japonica TaxID=39947 RepID=A0A0P0X8R6_ORYSJ|nr:Os07g0611550 [Oryza sativa Japonica Group]